MIFPSYDVRSTSAADQKTSLTDVFNVTFEYKNENLTLGIDLSAVDPLFVNSTVTGELTIMITNNTKLLYPIGFKLVCKSNSTYCKKVNPS